MTKNHVFIVFAILAGLVAFHSTRDGAAKVPILKYQFFQNRERELSTLAQHAFKFNEEAPIGAGKKTTMLLGIFSTSGSKYANRREYIRDTYLAAAGDKICKLSEFVEQVKQNPNERRCQVPYAFIVGAGRSDRPTDHDDFEPLVLQKDVNGHIDPEGDCIYLNIRENMEDGKSTTYFKFGSVFAEKYGIDYISKLDDDSVMSTKHLIQFIDNDLPPSPYNRRTYGGVTWASYAHSHMYAAGQFYFLSSDLADYVSNQLSPQERKAMMHWRHTEDADMGTFVFSHPRPIKFVNLSSYTFWLHPKKTEADFRLGWETQTKKLPGKGTILPFFHLCPVWLSGRGV